MNLCILLSVLFISSSLYCMEKEYSIKKSWNELTEQSEKNNPRGLLGEKVWRPQQNNSTNNRNQHQNDWQQPRRNNNSGNKNNDRQLQALTDLVKRQNQLTHESNDLLRQLLEEQKQILPTMLVVLKKMAAQNQQNLLSAMKFQQKEITALQEVYNHLLQGKQEEHITKMWELGCDRNQQAHNHNMELGRIAKALEALSPEAKSGDENNNNNDTVDTTDGIDGIDDGSKE